MRIGVLSDSHDNIWRLAEAMPHLAACDVIVHCGDLCSPFVVRRLGEGLPGKSIHIVWGNNDGDQFLVAQVARVFPGIVLHGEVAEIEVEGLRLAANHYPILARGLALTGRYDLVCYGHDHTAHEERVGDCLLLNPGELMGMNGRSTLALVDSRTRSVEMVDLSTRQ